MIVSVQRSYSVKLLGALYWQLGNKDYTRCTLKNEFQEVYIFCSARLHRFIAMEMIEDS